MDTSRPFVGKHSPRVKLDSSEPRGIRQSKLRVGGGKALRRQGDFGRRTGREDHDSHGLGYRRYRCASHHDSIAYTRISEIPVQVHAWCRFGGGHPGNSRHRDWLVPRGCCITDACQQYPGLSRRHDSTVQRSWLQDVQVAGWKFCFCIRLPGWARRSR